MARLPYSTVLPDGNNVYFDTVGPPTSATGGAAYKPGDMLMVLGTTKGLPFAHRCTVAGDPGTWELVASGGSAAAALVAITADGAVDPHTGATYVVTKAGVAAMTLAAPTAGLPSAGGDDGKRIRVVSNTANAHTLTATGLLGTGTASTDIATFAARLGSGLELIAYSGKWLVLSSVGITFS